MLSNSYTSFSRNTSLSKNEVLAKTGVKEVQNESDDEYNSTYEVYAWIEDGKLEWWSEADIVYFHPDTKRAFSSNSSVTNIDLTGTDTSLVKNFTSWFFEDSNLVRIDGQIDTSGLELKYNEMFNYANLDDNANSSGYGMSFMFANCPKLEYVDLSKFDTKNATDMKRMFYNCKKLTNLDVTHFETSNVKSFQRMFTYVPLPETFDLSNWNTSSAVNMMGMFTFCTTPKEIVLGENFDTSNVVNMKYMFYGMSNLTTIYAVKDFDRSNVSDSTQMFTNSRNIVGGKGTSYETPFNNSYQDMTYAQIANSSHSGYFTEIQSSSKYTITYNANGGSVSPTSKKIEIGETIGTLPTPTAPAGKTFTGWYTGLTDGVQVTSSYIPTSNIIIYARYYKDITGATIEPSSITLVVGDEENISVSNVEEEYTFSSNDTSIATVDQNGKVTGIGEGTTTITIIGSTSGKTKTINVEITLPEYTITLNPNGGTITTTSKQINQGSNIGTLPTPTKTGYTFTGWYTSLTDGIEVTDTYTPNNDITIYARYYKDITSATITPSSITLLVGNEETIEVTDVEEEYTFTSNNTSIATVDSTGKVTAISKGTTTITITGSTSGKTKTINVTITVPKYTISFDSQGGSSVSDIEIEQGSSIGTLPTSTKSGYTLEGWFTDEEYTTKITSSTIPTGNTTYYAKWIEPCNGFSTDSWSTIQGNIQSNPETYAVGCTKEVDMGTLGKHTVRVANTSTPEACATEGYSQTGCGVVLEFADIITTHRMNPYTNGSTNGDGNKGGWEYSEMRTYVNDDIYNALPTELKNAIIDTTVVSGHGSKDSVNFITTDKLYLLSTEEVWGSNVSWDTANAETRQLDYYANLGVTTSNYSGAIKKYNNSNSWWWLRSANSSYYITFFYVDNSGIDSSYYASGTYGVAPAFRIG